MDKKLQELSQLKENWDSYGGKPISDLAIAQAELFLQTFEVIQANRPQIVPTSIGGLQLEWHQGGFDLEVEILPSGEVGEVFSSKVDSNDQKANS
ncbi:MAG: hypothetical protein ACREBR_04550 [bacterium]